MLHSNNLFIVIYAFNILYSNCIYINYVCVKKIFTQKERERCDIDAFMTIWSIFRFVDTSFVMRTCIPISCKFQFSATWTSKV